MTVSRPWMLALLFLLGGAERLTASAGESPIVRRIQEAGEAPVIPPVERADQWTREVRSLPYAPLAATPDGGEARHFQVETRADKIQRGPCVTCHVKPTVEEARRSGADGASRGHGAIIMAHAPAERMACATCHDYSHEMTLKTVTGHRLDFDRAYELCAGCHGTQYADWQGGAHGKRLGNWTGVRVVRSCTGCHDPHRPAFPQRAPAIFAAPPSTWEVFRP